MPLPSLRLQVPPARSSESLTRSLYAICVASATIYGALCVMVQLPTLPAALYIGVIWFCDAYCLLVLIWVLPPDLPDWSDTSAATPTRALPRSTGSAARPTAPSTEEDAQRRLIVAFQASHATTFVAYAAVVVLILSMIDHPPTRYLALTLNVLAMSTSGIVRGRDRGWGYLAALACVLGWRRLLQGPSAPTNAAVTIAGGRGNANAGQIDGRAPPMGDADVQTEAQPSSTLGEPLILHVQPSS